MRLILGLALGGGLLWSAGVWADQNWKNCRVENVFTAGKNPEYSFKSKDRPQIVFYGSIASRLAAEGNAMFLSNGTNDLIQIYAHVFNTWQCMVICKAKESNTQDKYSGPSAFYLGGVLHAGDCTASDTKNLDSKGPFHMDYPSYKTLGPASQGTHDTSAGSP